LNNLSPEKLFSRQVWRLTSFLEPAILAGRNTAKTRVPDLMNGSLAAKSLFFQVIEETRLFFEQSTVFVGTAQKVAQPCLDGGSVLLLVRRLTRGLFLCGTSGTLAPTFYGA
jgi:hypothetical protein